VIQPNEQVLAQVFGHVEVTHRAIEEVEHGLLPMTNDLLESSLIVLLKQAHQRLVVAHRLAALPHVSNSLRLAVGRKRRSGAVILFRDWRIIAPVKVRVQGPCVRRPSHRLAIEDNRDTTVALGSIKRQLESEGWKDRDSEMTGKSLSQVRMTRGVERLVAFRQQRSIGEIMAARADKSHPKTPLVAHYEDLFSEEETEKALGGLLESGPPSDTLLLFERFFARSSLRDRFLDRSKGNP